MSNTQNGTIYHWSKQKRPSLPEMVTQLQAVGLFPKEKSWWFAWHEVDIQLPSRLRDINQLPTDWDVLHIFSPDAEFRQIRRGRNWQWLLLSEKGLPDELIKPRQNKAAEAAGIVGFFKTSFGPTKKSESNDKRLPPLWIEASKYNPIPSRRILWGNALHLPAKGDSGVEEGRGVVAFPRKLEYDVANEGGKNYQNALVADVLLYFDDEARLQTVRYVKIDHLPPGSVGVEPLEKVMKDFKPIPEGA